jgi:hypothetical protein
MYPRPAYAWGPPLRRNLLGGPLQACSEEALRINSIDAQGNVERVGGPPRLRFREDTGVNPASL